LSRVENQWVDEIVVPGAAEDETSTNEHKGSTWMPRADVVSVPSINAAQQGMAGPGLSTSVARGDGFPPRILVLQERRRTLAVDQEL